MKEIATIKNACGRFAKSSNAQCTPSYIERIQSNLYCRWEGRVHLRTDLDKMMPIEDASVRRLESPYVAAGAYTVSEYELAHPLAIPSGVCAERSKKMRRRTLLSGPH